MSASELLMLLQAAPATEPPEHYILTTENIFLAFFIMLGPVKVIGPFFAATRELDPAALRKLAFKIFVFAVIAVLIAGLVGGAMLRKWQISTPVMMIAGGLVFLLVALQMVLAQYEPQPPSSATGGPQVMHLVFPVTVTPYGVAALIVTMALSAGLERSLTVLGIALGVMVLNLLAMLVVRPIMHWIGPVPLQILGAVLGILQVALALQIIVLGLKQMGVPLIT